MEISSTLQKYLDDQTVQETWNDLQENVYTACCDNNDDNSVVYDADGMLWSGSLH